MGARSEETSAVHRSGEPVETKLRRIAEKALKGQYVWIFRELTM